MPHKSAASSGFNAYHLQKMRSPLFLLAGIFALQAVSAFDNGRFDNVSHTKVPSVQSVLP